MPNRIALEPSVGSLSRVVGRSPAVHRLEEAIARVGNVDCPVLVTGATGSGKDEAARAIHATGSRAARPFVPINCAGIVGTLAESLLFGHEKGSFTSADDSAIGAFRAAHGGILFLDEIGELPLDIQPKLLRVLALREVVSVGATKPVKVDVQVIAVTNRDLRREVAIGRFREDLLYRLNTIHVTVPPLRDRRDDIPLFVAHFVAECARRCGRQQRAATVGVPAATGISDTLNLAELRRDAVRRAFTATDGHYGRAATLLGVSAKTMTKLAVEACPGQHATRGRRRKPLPR